MEPFLKQIARVYVGQTQWALDKLCFVFPNRRSSTFFRMYLTEVLNGKATLLPDIRTISDFIGSLTHVVEANRIEQLFVLYTEYLKLSEEKLDFDQFLFWGDMILTDFNDVDRYMVDAKELFSNVSSYKEINANYLTDEQKDVIKEFWGKVNLSQDDDNLWADNHAGREENSKRKFIKLWEILYPLYSAFKKALQENGMSYSGMTYRQAAMYMEKASADDFPYSKIVFVGFSTLSVSERKIFDRFRDIGIGDFYWDFNSPAFDDPDTNKGAFFLRQYVERYPSAFDLGESKIDKMPEIHILSVPSGGGQAKVAGQIIADLAKKGELDTNNAINTAVVLPEEKFLNSVLFSIPAEIQGINVTMGYPLSQTSIASFMSILAMLHARKRVLDGKPSYYYEDLNALLAHPYVKPIERDGVSRLQKEMRDRHYFFVPADVVQSYLPGLKLIFTDLRGATPGEIVNYAGRIVEFIYKSLSPRKEDDGQKKLELFYIRQYRNSLMQLGTAIKTYGISMQEKTFFFLLDRMLAACSIAFEGEPLKGLQVMGVLETRLLDFDNMIILSMNEKIFPSKHYSRSFIPNALREGYGIATYEYQDSMFTYYFYRMISRCKNVYLLYDSRVQGVSSGEESRYIYQIRQLYNRGLCKNEFYEYNLSIPKENNIAVEKSPRVKDMLKKYTEAGSGKNFSASMINTYIDCPLRFYLSKVEGLKEEEEMEDFIDSATFGNVVHKVMQNIYASMPGKKGNQLVKEEYIQEFLKSNSLKLDRIITEVINSEYNKIGEGNCAKLEGEAELIGRIVAYYIRCVLTHDEQLTPFTYIGSEIESQFKWDMGNGLVVNYKQFIDRMDRLSSADGDVLRIVDYKTGSDKTDIKGLDDLFESPGENSPRRKAILQLMLYCNAYAYYKDYKGPIQPVIYSVRNATMYRDKKFELTCAGKPISDYHDINEGFMERIRNIVCEILDDKTPFTQTDDIRHCLYCPFSEACGRSGKA